SCPTTSKKHRLRGRKWTWEGFGEQRPEMSMAAHDTRRMATNSRTVAFRITNVNGHGRRCSPRHRTGDVGIPPDVAVSRPRARHAEEPSAGSGQSSPRGGGAHLSETRSLRRLPSIGLTSRRSLQGDGGAGGLQGLLRLVGGLLVDLLQDGLRRALDEV